MNQTMLIILLCLVLAAVAIILLRLLTKKSSPKVVNDDTDDDQGGFSPHPTGDNGRSAKDAFISNIDCFIDLLPQLNEDVDIKAWTEKIVDVNNARLLAIWKKSINHPAIWKTLLSSWGLRQDTCKSFTYLDKYSKIYDTIDGSVPVEGAKYRVKEGGWILTKATGEKSVIKKGVIEKMS